MEGVLLNFTLLMAASMGAGWPLLNSLRVIAGVTDGAFKVALKNVIKQIESGKTFSEALAREPKVFDPFYVIMVKAGEAGGALEIIFQRLGQFQLEPLKNELAYNMRLLGCMIEAKVPIKVALETLVILCQGREYLDFWQRANQEAERGGSLFSAFKLSLQIHNNGRWKEVIIGEVNAKQLEEKLGKELMALANLIEAGA